MLPDLLPRAGAFPSGEPSDNYALVLKGQGPVVLGQGAKAYKFQLAREEGDTLVCAALEVGRPAQNRAAPALKDKG